MTTAPGDAPAPTGQDSNSDSADAAAPPAAAGIAQTVGRVLAMAAAAASPSRPGDAAEIEAITDAMIRLLVGTPLRSDGQPTIKSLAQETDLKRNKLTHKHTGLKDLFYALVRMQDARPKVVDDLKRKNDELQHKLTRLARPGGREPAAAAVRRQRRCRSCPTCPAPAKGLTDACPFEAPYARDAKAELTD
ncbi:hypothetical protein ABZ865_30000 [Streptomyces sp. NPDC047085]|uniref:hypothetical protein n=1 Tax=Streptomyces sp. NPDC047085 TaxID=3155140 RepID=UPI0033DE3832